MGWFSSFIYSQMFVTLPIPIKDFSGQTVIITGSNTGLGFEATRHVARLNASLIIMAVRNVSKGEVAKRLIIESTKRPAGSIQVWELDMQNYDSIKAFAVKAGQLQRIDAVLENAGIMTKHFKIVAGYESTITTNVIGTFLLALLILPKLKESALKYNTQPRLSIVTSDLHFLAKFPECDAEDIFDALNNEQTAEMSMERWGLPLCLSVYGHSAAHYFYRYAVSKLLEVFVVREITSVLSQTQSKMAPVIINCMTPGACKSDFDRESSGLQRYIGMIMASIIARSTEAGSRALVAGIAAGEESHGAYMENCIVAE